MDQASRALPSAITSAVATGTIDWSNMSGDRGFGATPQLPRIHGQQGWMDSTTIVNLVAEHN
jgi:hypothetical protein